MDQLEGFLEKLKPQKDTDTIDRLLTTATPLLCIIGALFVIGWEFVGDPISCWFPAYYSGFWVQYALDYCFVQNTYFLPMTDVPARNYWELGQQLVPIPQNVTDREDRLIGYYQWVGFFLAIQGIMFYLPVVMWRSMYSVTGIKVESICETLTNTDNLRAETRQGNVAKVARFLDQTIGFSKRVRQTQHKRSAGNTLTLLYLLMKISFFANCIFQFFILKKFLGTESYFWGWDIIGDLYNGHEWKETGHFPRVTLCDFEVKVLGNIHRHTVQCVLMINMFNEKIFLILWWWILIMLVLSFISLLRWTVKTFVAKSGRSLIKSYIKRVDSYDENLQTPSVRQRNAMVDAFIDDRLRRDGVFLIMLAASNAGDLVCSEVVALMWRSFKKEREELLGQSGNNGNGKNIYDGEGGDHPSPPRVRMAQPSAPNKDHEYPTLPMPRNRQPPPAYEEGL